MADPGIDISTAMKLIHSSNAKRTEAEKDPLAKEVLSSLKELKMLQIDLNKAVDAKDEAKAKLLQESIKSLKKVMEDKGVSETFMSEDGEERLKDYLSDELIAEIKNDMGELTDDTVAALVKMMQTGKSLEDGNKMTPEMEESLFLVMSATLSKAGLTRGKDIKDIINYLKSMKTDITISNDSIGEIIQMNTSMNNHLVNIMKDGETNSYILAEILSNLDDNDMKMLMSMENLPTHITDAIELEERQRDLSKYPFGQYLLSLESDLGKFTKKFEN